MRNLFLIFFILTSISMANAAVKRHNPGIYVRGDVAAFIPANKFKESFDDPYTTKRPKRGAAYNIGLGYALNDMWRGDLNFNYRVLNYKGEEVEEGILEFMRQRMKIYAFFLNSYFDINCHKVIKPYLTVGLGYTRNKTSDALSYMDGLLMETFPGKKTNNFAWNVGVGTRSAVNNRFHLDISYKYVYLGKVSNGTSEDGTAGRTFRVKSHDIMGGVIIFV